MCATAHGSLESRGRTVPTHRYSPHAHTLPAAKLSLSPHDVAAQSDACSFCCVLRGCCYYPEQVQNKATNYASA